MTHHPDPFLYPEDESTPLLASPSLWAVFLVFWTLVILGAVSC